MIDSNVGGEHEQVSELMLVCVRKPKIVPWNKNVKSTVHTKLWVAARRVAIR